MTRSADKVFAKQVRDVCRTCGFVWNHDPYEKAPYTCDPNPEHDFGVKAQHYRDPDGGWLRYERCSRDMGGRPCEKPVVEGNRGGPYWCWIHRPAQITDGSESAGDAAR